MKKKIMTFNVGGADRTTIYVGGYSKADACRQLAKASGNTVNQWSRHLTIYGSPCWGTVMTGIKPKRGIWIAGNWGKPKPPHRARRVSF
jgi:hypothetical protein